MHVKDIHEHNIPAFPCCPHPPLVEEVGNKELLEPGTTCCVQYAAENISGPIFSVLFGTWYIFDSSVLRP